MVFGHVLCVVRTLNGMVTQLPARLESPCFGRAYPQRGAMVPLESRAVELRPWQPGTSGAESTAAAQSAMPTVTP